MVNEIKELAKKNKTSISKIEKELKFANGYIRRWDEQKPSYDRLLAVAKYLNVPVSYFTETNEIQKEEAEIISFYRKADERGKDRIYKTAKDEADQAEQLLQQKDNITDFSKEIKPFA